MFLKKFLFAITFILIAIAISIAGYLYFAKQQQVLAAGNIINAASCEQADVQTAINQAIGGDAVIVPAGNCVWNGVLTITRGIKLQGSGIDNTIITGNIICSDSPCTKDGVIKYSPNVIARTNNEAIRITGFTIDASGKSINILIRAQDPDHLITNNRVDHNKLIGGTSACVYIGDGRLWGIIDNNQFIDCYTIARVYGYYWYDWDRSPLNIGSGDGVIIEDNTAIYTGQRPFGNILSGGHGGRYTFRYNVISNIPSTASWIEGIDAHGNNGAVVDYNICSTCDVSTASCCLGNRGVVSAEVYYNTISLAPTNTSGTFRFIGLRGGSDRIFMNNISQQSKAVTFTLMEEDGPGYQNLLSTWPGYDPVKNTYIWNNIKISAKEVITSFIYSSDPTFLQFNRDYWIYNNSFDGSTGIGVGALSMRPAVCTVGTGYWANDQDDWNHKGGTSGALYRCVSTNNWDLYYTPYTYPHPLTIDTSPPLKGDFNTNGKVDIEDFTSFKNAFKSIFNSIFDLNSDNTIDVKDLGVLMSGWLE